MSATKKAFFHVTSAFKPKIKEKETEKKTRRKGSPHDRNIE